MTVNPSKHKILLVDDEPAIRRILLRLLAEEGYRVLAADNGFEALEDADAGGFDLVLLDLNTPDHDGWKIFGQFSARNPDLPVILITARPKQFFFALASGVGALLEKSTASGELDSTIETLLKKPAEVRIARWNGRSSTSCRIPSRFNGTKTKTS
jgi:DNA-binding response OmpR family regulator